MVLDVGLLKDPTNFKADIPRQALSEAAGQDLDALIEAAKSGRYEVAVEELGRGAVKIVYELYQQGKIDGVLGIGGSMGTALSLKMLRVLPVGFPKVLISTVALSDYLHPHFVKSDITLIQPIVDFWGLNQWVKRDLRRAANTISVMVNEDEPMEGGNWIAMTAIGWTAACLPKVKKALEDRGLKVAVSHSVSMQGAILEQLIRQKVIKGMVDLCPFEIVHELAGGSCHSRDRMDAAAQMGIPTVVGPGALTVFTMNTLDMARFKEQGRFTVEHNEILGTAKPTLDEIAEAAWIMATKLNTSTAKTALIIPKRGFHTYDNEGKMYNYPEARKAFIRIVKKTLHPRIELEVLDCHIDDPEYGDRVLEKSLEYFKDIV
jgi:uncharacterized protein (UPF0261 family)